MKSLRLLFPLLALVSFLSAAHASMVITQWYHGTWNCNIDGRSAQMVWQVVDDSRTTCNGDICSTTSGVKTVGWFSDSGSAWVRLDINSSSNRHLAIRYLGNEPDNWLLNYDAAAVTASGWTTWRGNRYPLSCWNRRR
ncbi:MAG: hypothetical protein HQK50_12820 [Oligoflexia bacterium]|nr:hypothetical protein [Oligoflexia bacterium]MBF0366447.1 hypothetical protein [Oligoflexia bacterium]